MPSEQLHAALGLAAHGFAVFPLVYPTKVPFKNSRGLYDASSNGAVIRRWFGGTMEKNLAVRTGTASGCWVLDVDDPGALEALEARYGSLPVTRQSQTARGVHHWWRLGPTPIPGSTGRIAPHVDVRGDGGYVVAPPSVHETGIVYEWLNAEPLAEAPAWLVELATRRPPPSISEQALAHRRPPQERGAPGSSAYGQAALEAEIGALAAMPPNSGRNTRLNAASFNLHRLVAGGVLEAREVERRLIEACHANRLVEDDGLPQCTATIRSGARAGLQHPRAPKGGAR